jgi:hypothetical protein
MNSIRRHVFAFARKLARPDHFIGIWANNLNPINRHFSHCPYYQSL